MSCQYFFIFFFFQSKTWCSFWSTFRPVISIFRFWSLFLVSCSLNSSPSAQDEAFKRGYHFARYNTFSYSKWQDKNSVVNGSSQYYNFFHNLFFNLILIAKYFNFTAFWIYLLATHKIYLFSKWQQMQLVLTICSVLINFPKILRDRSLLIFRFVVVVGGGGGCRF